MIISEKIKSKKFSAQEVAGALKRAGKNAVLFPAPLKKDELLSAAQMLDRGIFSFFAMDKKDNLLGTFVFAHYGLSAFLRGRRSLFDEKGNRIFASESQLFLRVLNGSFDFSGNCKSQYKSLRFGMGAFYLSEESIGYFLEHFLVEVGYADIMLLPFFAVRKRLLVRARQVEFGRFYRDKISGLDPSLPRKDMILRRYDHLLLGANDEKKMLVCSPNEARILRFSFAKARKTGLLKPIDMSLGKVANLSYPEIEQEFKCFLRECIERGVFKMSDNLFKAVLSTLKKPLSRSTKA